jgi:hypothetical protein
VMDSKHLLAKSADSTLKRVAQGVVKASYACDTAQEQDAYVEAVLRKLRSWASLKGAAAAAGATDAHQHRGYVPSWRERPDC